MRAPGLLERAKAAVLTALSNPAPTPTRNRTASNTVAVLEVIAAALPAIQRDQPSVTSILQLVVRMSHAPTMLATVTPASSLEGMAPTCAADSESPCWSSPINSGTSWNETPEMLKA